MINDRSAYAAAIAAREASVARAERDLEDINRLLENDPFNQYFRRRLRERRAAHALALEADQSETATAQLRARIAEIDEIIAMPERDRANHNATLAPTPR